MGHRMHHLPGCIQERDPNQSKRCRFPVIREIGCEEILGPHTDHLKLFRRCEERSAEGDPSAIIHIIAVREEGVGCDDGLINLKPDAEDCAAVANDLYAKLQAGGGDPLLDDRDDRPGAKLASIDLIGIPWQIVIGPRGMANGVVEVKNRKTGEAIELSPDAAFTMVMADV